MKKQLILHLGPTRTSTTYLFNLLLHNNQFGVSTQMNIPRSQIQLLQWVLSRKLPHNHPLTGSIYMLANNIKEDPSVNRLYAHSTTGHPLHSQTENPHIDSVIQLWLNRLNNHTLDINPQHYSVTHNCQQHIPWLSTQLNYPHSVEPNTLLWGDCDDTLSDLPIVAFAPTLTNGGMFTNEQQYTVKHHTTTAQLIECVPHRQHKLITFVNALSRNFHSVQLLIGLRNPTERMHSWINHLSAVLKPSEVEQLIQLVKQHSYTNTHSQQMRNWIDHQFKLYSDYPILSTLTQQTLPDNVQLTTYHHHTPTQQLFPHISTELNTSVPTLSSKPTERIQLNSAWCELNDTAYNQLSNQVTPL